MGRPKKEKPKHSSGMYEYKATIGHSFDGKPIRKSFYSSTSKEAAKLKAEDYIVNQRVAEQTGETFVSKEECFDTWALKWLETYKKDKIKEQSYEFTYKKNIENYLIPYFKHAKLDNIKQIDIQQYFNNVKNRRDNTPLSWSVLDKHKMILHAIFDAAIDNDLCRKNPVKNIDFPNIAEKNERSVYTEEEATILEKYCLDNKRYDIIILLETGMRRSELCGLMWKDIDKENKTIYIKRAVTQMPGKIIIDKPKSINSIRVIPYGKFLSEIIELIPQTSEYVIPGDEPDKPKSPHSYGDSYKDFMVKACNTLNLKVLTPHELRHTYGTIQRKKDVDIYTIQKVMGHSDISTTAKIYVHNDIEVLRKKMKID